jgi:serine/threonine-protein kinase
MTTEVFYITCNLASEIVETYGLGKAEETLVEAFVDNHPTRHIRTRSIPILDITGSKVSQWQDFVETFKIQQSNRND